MACWSSFYAAPPTRAIALDELEHAGLLRLRVLRVLAATPSVERLIRTAQNLPETARDALARLDADCDLDSVAHYALRLAFCTDRDRLEWLVDAEARLMVLRLRSRHHDEALGILSTLNKHYRVCKREELAGSVGDSASEWAHQFHPSSTTYFRVPFQEAARLVGRRHVLMDHGYCWLPATHIYLLVAHAFTSSLRTQLTALHRSLPGKRHEIERLQDVIDRIYADSMLLHSRAHVTAFAKRQEVLVTPQNVDDIAEKHFPLCMRHLHRKLRENHHLKFDGRVQYRVFLKGLGFSVHDSIVFFRNEFTRVIPPAKFDREYVYHIRHSYGLEGSRKDYAPMDCEKIILGSAPRHGQYHGCPFKHWDGTSLGNELRRVGVSRNQAEAIARTANQGQHQKACASLFEALHHRPYQALDTIDEAYGASQMHPNQWVHASLQGTEEIE